VYSWKTYLPCFSQGGQEEKIAEYSEKRRGKIEY
jgi:hypothetical protein